MDIIRYGAETKNKECYECNSILKYNKYDIKSKFMSGSVNCYYKYYIECPICKTRLSIIDSEKI